jgi:hypothetical protein
VPSPTYPWYKRIRGDEITQGEILEGCPVFLPSADLATRSLDDASLGTVNFQWKKLDVIVMTQTCDLVQGRAKVEDVLLCAVWKRSQIPANSHLATPKGMEEARRGNYPAYHVLAECSLANLQREVRIVDFHRIYTLPLPFFRRLATSAGYRLRLLPPYREHLAQAFARFFMRVGLPVDIPPFR